MASAEYMRNYRKLKPHITRAAAHRYYATHKDEYIRAREEARARIHKLVRTAREVPCQDCGGNFPWYVMEFDHTRGTKSFSIARATANGINKVRDELDKCDVVCANCHVVRTYKRGQWFRGNQRKYDAG